MARTNLAIKIVFALVGFTLLALISLFFSVQSIRSAMNNQSKAVSIPSVESRMDALHDKLRMIARDYNNWADVFLALQRNDLNFVADNYAITAIYGDIFNAVAMFDGSLKRPIAWLENGNRMPTQSFLSERDMAKIRDRVKLLDSTKRQTFDFYMTIKGDLYFMSASYVLPDTDALIKQANMTNLSIAVLARRLRDWEVIDMQRALMIRDVKVSQHVDPMRSSIPLPGVDGAPAAFLSWLPSRAGDALVLTMSPVLIGIVAAFLLMAAIGIIAVHRHAQDLVRRERSATNLARVDTLTGLANRLAFNERLASCVAGGNDRFALMIIDLNGFKRINDMVGHQGGDEILRQVGLCLAHLEQDNIFVARLGGDEFGIVVSGADDLLQTVEYLSNRIIAQLHCPLVVQGHSFEITAAQGAAISGASGASAEEILRRADYAMYHAKSRKSSKVKIYTESMERKSQFDRQIELALRTALDRPSEFSVHYQPIVEAKSGQIARAEALARWKPPFLGQVDPENFIRIAEESALIIPLGWLLLNQICRDVKRLPSLSVNINVSPIQLMDDFFVEELLRVLALHEIRPERVEIEVTESVMILNAEIIEQRLRELRQAGISLALDDFGSGFSSFGSLRALPFDTLKIDKTLVACAAETPRNRAFVHSVVMLGQSMGRRVVGEGIETEGDARYLLKMGCDLLQGYLFGKPMPIDELASQFFEVDRISA